MNHADDRHPGVWSIRRARGRRLVLLPWLVLLTLLAVEGPSLANPGREDGAAPALTVLRSDDAGLELLLRLPPLERQPLAATDLTPELLHLEGFENVRQPGLPAVPQLALWLAIPPHSDASVEPLSSVDRLEEGVQVAPAATSELVDYDYDRPDSTPQFAQRRQPDALVYSTDAFFPSAPVSLGQPRTVQGMRLVPLLIHPVRFNPLRRQLLIQDELALRVSFAPRDTMADAAALEETALSSGAGLLSTRVLNYAEAITWPSAASPATGTVVSASPCLNGNAFRIAVAETGMVQLDQGALQAAGLPASVPADSLRMCHRDQEIAIRIQEGNGNGQFEAGDAIYFYAETLRTQETHTNVYWLTYGGEDGLRIAEEDGTPDGSPVPAYYTETVRLESDSRYYSQIPRADDNDHWYWRAPLDSSGDNQLVITFELAQLSAAGGDLPLRVELWGFRNDTDHTYQVKLNNDIVGPAEATFSGSGIAGATMTFEAPVNPGLFQEGLNTLTIRALPNSGGSHHQMLVNRAEVTVERTFNATGNRVAFAYPTPGNRQFSVEDFSSTVAIYDVSDPAQPIRVTTPDGGPGTVRFSRTTDEASRFFIVGAGGYQAPQSIAKDTPSNLRATNTVADYIIITDPVLTGALQPLIDRRSIDYAVKLVTVQDIFDEFNYGIYAAEAIQSFLHYAYDNWQGTGAGPNGAAPSFVLLAGEGSYDHRNVLGLNGATGNLVPVYLRSGVDNNLGETAADNQYVDFDGDDLADMLLGRIPARSAAELTAVVSKILAYEDAPATRAWQWNHLFFSDNGFRPPTADPSDPCTEDAAGDFFWHVDNFLANHFPGSGQSAQRIYYAPPDCYPRAEYPTYEPYFAVSPQEATLRFIEKFNLGSQMVTYIGHSSNLEWGFEDFMTTDLVAQLSNEDRTPIMLPMTCLTGYYHDPAGDSLSEAFLKLVNGGSVASYAPTGFQVQTGHDLLLEGFYQAAYEDRVATLGEAVLGAKLYLAVNDPSNAYDDLQDTFMLLGDPALKLSFCETCTRTFLPVSLAP